MVPAFRSLYRWVGRSPARRRSTRSPRAALAAAAAVLLLTWAGPSAAAGAGDDQDESLRGPDVTIIAGKNRTIYEFRQNGELRMVRIVPAFGKPYYLVPADPSKGFGNLERADMLVPSWVIVRF